VNFRRVRSGDVWIAVRRTFVEITFHSTRRLTFCLLQKSGSDTGNFDTEFTREPARLTNIGKHLLMTIDQALFEGFSFTNPALPNTGSPAAASSTGSKRY
jgi:hypothetical protein